MQAERSIATIEPDGMVPTKEAAGGKRLSFSSLGVMLFDTF
jgi:hypothetical protein